MIEERFTDAERSRLLWLVLVALQHGVPVTDHAGKVPDPAELRAIVAKLVGVDTVLVARRAR